MFSTNDLSLRKLDTVLLKYLQFLLVTTGPRHGPLPLIILDLRRVSHKLNISRKRCCKRGVINADTCSDTRRRRCCLVSRHVSLHGSALKVSQPIMQKIRAKFGLLSVTNPSVTLLFFIDGISNSSFV